MTTVKPRKENTTTNNGAHHIVALANTITIYNMLRGQMYLPCGQHSTACNEDHETSDSALYLDCRMGNFKNHKIMSIVLEKYS